MMSIATECAVNERLRPEEFEKEFGIRLQKRSCPSCGSEEVQCFYHVDGLPVHSVLLLRSAEAAKDAARGDIVLGMCKECGFVANMAFDEKLLNYCPECEESQAFSGVFNSFHERLTGYLIQKYDLRKKRIIEIGCGKGEFLTLLCEKGGNSGVGFDPAYVPGRNAGERNADVRFVQDFYSDRYADEKADFICCKMTLEHIHDTGNFIANLYRCARDNPETVIFFQVPDISRIFKEVAFWDVYYEHCSYFSKGSLAHLFEISGFEVLKNWTEYGGQYLMIEAKPSEQGASLRSGGLKAETAAQLSFFAGHSVQIRERWKKYLQRNLKNKKRTVLWGSGSKAVSFLNTLGIEDEIEYIVDINEYRQNSFSAGTGQMIVAPKFLREYRPDEVIIMNPIYRDEIGGTLAKMGVWPDINTVLLPDVMGV